MPYCPECKGEYRKGFTKCSDCDVELVDTMPVDETVPVVAVPMQPFDEEVVLETITDNIEFMYVVSMLEEMDILFRVRGKGAGSFKSIYLGHANVERTIYIDNKDYDRAVGVLASINAEIIDDDMDDDSQE